MSFATETKNELARIMPEKTCCELAEIAGFMRFAGSIGLAGLGKFKIVMTTPNIAVVRHYKKLIKDYFDVDIAIEVKSVFLANAFLPAPMACDEIVETVCIIVDGTRKRNEIIFSTIPTAALISTPRLFAIIVIMRKAT